MEEPKYIIAIGASAGGMEEINTFFEHTPLDGVAYVIVQHLSSEFKSRMVELLSKHSKLDVQEAVEGTAVCTNMVYLIPNNKFMTISDNRLHLTNKSELKGPHLTINTFFKSLAADKSSKAIGVILSGLGSDGSEGIKAIKEAGGMIIARNPESSEFSSMPAHAIATDMVDFILEPEAMPKAIDSYVRQNEERMNDSKNDDKTIAMIIDYIREKLPFDFSDYKMTTILRRTKRRAASLNIYSLEDYFELLKNTPEEVADLSKDFLISVTSFFRDPDAYDVIQNDVFPQILENLAPHEEIKIWVAGCATGEEAYSLAIVLKGMLKGKLSDTVVKIFATDIDAAALTAAGKGVYASDRVKQVRESDLKKYFTKNGDNYTISPEIRKMLIFAQHDLVKNPPYCNMHFISCRNVLIYMAPVLQKKVYSMLLFGLRSNGYLFLGSSENPLSIIDSLGVVDKKWRIYKSLKNKRTVPLDTFSLPQMIELEHKGMADKDTPVKYLQHSLTENVNVALADTMDYLAVCVDQDNNVIKTYGNTGNYLLQQNFNTNLLDLLPKPLTVAYNTLRRQVLKTDERAAVQGIMIKQHDKIIAVGLSISPLKLEGSRKGLIAVFSNNSVNHTNAEYPVFNEVDYHNKYTLSLEEDLKQAKTDLKISYDKLDASNENMQSFNEELISANEEMQSTNEEMQSVNEELHTINADYQLKNKELLEINDDLNNYFRSNINGQLFIDNEMRLMKFSPGAVKHINLLDTDIGRPITHISTNIKFETIIADTKLVLEKGTVISKEIEADSGKWYQVMIMPYVQAIHRNNGAIITFNEITELKQIQTELNKKNQTLMRINSDLDHFVHAASHDLLGPLGNIEASINLLNDELPIQDSSQSEFLMVINSSIQKFRSLITEIATVAKVESDIATHEAVSLTEMIDSIEWSLKNNIAASETTIIRSLEIPYLQFSKKNLRSILYNLIANAIKFRSTTAPIVKISTYYENDNCILTVEDNGKGIQANGIHKIFEMYGRLHQGVEGSGIGLYLVKKIINADGGTILVESEPGKGTKFIISLIKPLEAV